MTNLPATLALSPLETAWMSLRSSGPFVTRNTPRYDSGSMMFYLSVEHDVTNQERASLALPNASDLLDAFLVQVKGDVDTRKDYGTMSLSGPTNREDVLSIVAHHYLDACERLFHTGLMDTITSDRSEPDESRRRALQCLALVCHPDLGNAKNKRYLTPDTFIAAVQKQEANKAPLQFIVPSFPFKDQNPFRTSSNPDHVDLGEVALLIRLHALALAIAQIYPYGVEWIIVCDGVVYADFLGVPRGAAIRYRERLREWRNRLNLQRTVHILDFEEVIKRAGPCALSIDGAAPRSAQFPEVFSTVLSSIETTLLAGGAKQEALAKMTVFARGMAWNINTHDLLAQYGPDALWTALTTDGSTSTAPAPLLDELQRRSWKAALQYGSFNLAAKLVSVLDYVFPGAIRATVHAKRDQVAIPCLGEVYPWNGVAFVRAGEMTPRSVETRALYEIREEPVASSYFVGDEAPFFFRYTGV